MIKKILIFFFLTLNFLVLFAAAPLWDDTIRSQMVPEDTNTVISLWSGDGLWVLDTFLQFIRDSLFKLLALISVAIFLLIGGKLLIARGNPEEFKKALFSFIYTIIGLIIIGLSYAAVKLIVWIKI